MRCTIIAIIIAIGTMLAGCASTANVNPMLQEVQSAYREIAEDSVVVNNAPKELQQAQKAVGDVRSAIANNESKSTVEQKSLLAEQRIRIAKKTAELRATRNSVRRKTAELQALLNTLQNIERNAIVSGHIKQPAEERAGELVHFRVSQTDRGLVFRFRELQFSSEKAVLVSNAEPPVNELAEFLSLYPKRTIRIEGYTDNTGSASFNKKLSQQRANVVRDALISRGVNGSRIEAVGMGEAHPVATNETEAGREQNRRVEIVLSDNNGVIGNRK